MGFNVNSSVKGRGGTSKMGVEGEVTEVSSEGVVSGGREESVQVEIGTFMSCCCVLVMVEGCKES